MGIRYLIFDAGGTVVFPNQDVMAEVAGSFGCAVPADTFFASLFRVFHRYDAAYRAEGHAMPVTAPPLFREVFELADVPCDAALRCAEELLARHEKLSLWTYTYEWVKPALERLQAAGWPMAVVSNSDGRVHEHLIDCGLDHFFDRVFDSAVVGIEKPDPRFFHHALDALDLRAAEALYIGDIFCIDVLGANRAGIGAVHLDPVGLYEDWPGVHLPDIRALPGWLEAYARDPEAFDLFPALTMFEPT
jgi:HAD superfamily hydrolase (TIGR01549 family)